MPCHCIVNRNGERQCELLLPIIIADTLCNEGGGLQCSGGDDNDIHSVIALRLSRYVPAWRRWISPTLPDEFRKEASTCAVL